jgi:hypothetical protein
MTMPNDATPSPVRTAGIEAAEERRSGGARAQIREVKDQVVDQARNSFRQARDSATNSLSNSRQQAADRIGGIASAFRSTSDHLRSEHQAGVANLTDSLADQVERVSDYLRDRDLRDLGNDVENLARRQPALVLGAALAIGMLGARFFKSSERSGRREEFRGGQDWDRGNDEGPYGLTGGSYGGA